MEQRELLAEAKRLQETGELFPRGTAEEPHAPDAEAEASDSEPEAHVMEPLADDHSSDSDDTPTGIEESAAPAAPRRTVMSLLERLQAIRIILREQATIMTALSLCVVRKMSSASPARARACPRQSRRCRLLLHVLRQFHRLHSEQGQLINVTAIKSCPSFGGCLWWHHTQEWSLRLNVPQHGETHQVLTQ